MFTGYKASADGHSDAYKAGMGSLHSLKLGDFYVNIANSYSNFTPRKNAYMNFSDLSDGHIVVFGTRDTFQSLVDFWNDTFFYVDKKTVMDKLTRRTRHVFGTLSEHAKYLSDMESLYDLRYLPLEVLAIDEGTKYPIGLPVFTVKATVDNFGWLVNYIETPTSGLIWPMINTATKVEQFYLQANYYGNLSAPENIVSNWLPICVHEFGMRGYRGLEDQVRTSACHSLFFLGSDTMAVVDYFEDSYDTDSEVYPIAVSVRATEHADISRMLSSFRYLAKKSIEEGVKYKVVKLLNTKEDQESFQISTLSEGECVRGYRGGYFINENEIPVEVHAFDADPEAVLRDTEFFVLKWFVENSTGIMSYVSDTENYYRLLNVYAKTLKDSIIERKCREDGQPAILVFRPDSSRRTPLAVICGYTLVDIDDMNLVDHSLNQDMCFVDIASDEYFLWDLKTQDTIRISKEEALGSLNSLWNTFGGEEIMTEAGMMRFINPAVGLIYGEAISQSHQKEIYERMIGMGFSVVNVLMGKGSYASLENSTRDLFSMSYKQTFSEAIVSKYNTCIELSDTDVITPDMVKPGVCFMSMEMSKVQGSDEFSHHFIVTGFKGDVPLTKTIPSDEYIGERVNLEQQKTPMGDMSKKSAKGLLRVEKTSDGFVLHQEQTENQEQEGELTLLLRNGIFYKQQTLPDIKETYLRS